MSYGIDEADDPLSLQKDKRSKFISRIPQRSEEDSFSVAEKTDKIINYSAVLNTSEELIEAAVNQSSTLRNDHCASSVINSSLLHKIMPQPNGSFSGKSPAREEVMLDKIDKSKIIITNNFDPNDKE